MVNLSAFLRGSLRYGARRILDLFAIAEFDCQPRSAPTAETRFHARVPIRASTESSAPGSSLSRVPAFRVMNFAIAPGVQRRTHSAQELGILDDIAVDDAG